MKNLFVLQLLVFSILVSTQPLCAQVESEQTRVQLNRPQAFFFDALNFAQIDSFGLHSRLDLYVKIPYDIIRFVKADQVFKALYTMTVIISDESGNRLKEDSWEKTLTQVSFEATVTATAHDLSQRSYLLPSGIVVIEAIFEDGESSKEYRLTKRFEVRRFDQNLCSMSDIMLVSNVTESGGKKYITPHVAPNVAALKNEFHLFFEVYHPFEEQQAILHYEARSSKNVVSFSKDDQQTLKQGKNTFITKVSQGAFDVGTYMMDIAVRRPNDTTTHGVLASARTSFIMEWISEGSPVTISDLDAAIEQLRYFARPSDLSYIKEATNEKDKRKRFEEFWETYNPLPGSKVNQKMVEFYRRVAYANEHFKHFLDGWKTDRGMVYIINGAPSYVDRHPFEIETKPYEVWEYYDLNRRYIFVDESGFGDYRLMYPLTDERNRIR